MIQETLKFLMDELSEYLSSKLGTTTEERIVLGNVARIGDAEGNGNGALAGKIVISLVNIEEDRVSKVQEHYRKTDTGIEYKNPPILLNVYVLFTINRTSYTDCMTWLSHIIAFFQKNAVFTPDNFPSLDARIKKLVAELYTLSFEQINHLWGTLGGKYMPSVMYKIRQLTIDEQHVYDQGPPIEIIQTDAIHKPATN